MEGEQHERVRISKKTHTFKKTAHWEKGKEPRNNGPDSCWNVEEVQRVRFCANTEIRDEARNRACTREEEASVTNHVLGDERFGSTA